LIEGDARQIGTICVSQTFKSGKGVRLKFYKTFFYRNFSDAVNYVFMCLWHETLLIAELKYYIITVLD
jgi:hypothetical protein